MANNKEQEDKTQELDPKAMEMGQRILQGMIEARDAGVQFKRSYFVSNSFLEMRSPGENIRG